MCGRRRRAGGGRLGSRAARSRRARAGAGAACADPTPSRGAAAAPRASGAGIGRGRGAGRAGAARAARRRAGRERAPRRARPCGGRSPPTRDAVARPAAKGSDRRGKRGRRRRRRLFPLVAGRAGPLAPPRARRPRPPPAHGHAALSATPWRLGGARKRLPRANRCPSSPSLSPRRGAPTRGRPGRCCAWRNAWLAVLGPDEVWGAHGAERRRPLPLTPNAEG